MRKKGLLKRGLLLGMSLALGLGLCACGEGKTMENAELAKEHVYRMQEIELPGLANGGNSWSNILQSVYFDGKIYVVARTNSYDEETYEEEEVYSLISVNADGTEPKSTVIQIPKKEEEIEETVETETAEEVAGDTVDAPTADAEKYPEDYAATDTWEYINYNNFTLTADGKLYAVKVHTIEHMGDVYTSEGKYYICHWSEDGSLLWEKELEGIGSNEDEYLSVRNVVSKPDGSLNLLVVGDRSLRVSVDADGDVSEIQTLSDEILSVINNSERILSRADGTLLVLYHDENDWAKTYYADFNIETGTMGEEKELPSSVFRAWDYNHMGLRLNGDLYYTSNSGIYTYTFGEEEPKMLMDYINSDFGSGSFTSLVEISDTSFAAVFHESGEILAGVFNYVSPEEIADKAVVVLACNYLDYRVKERVIEFNRTNEEYRIVTKEYNIYNTYEDYNAGMTKLNNDIIAGNMPDILVNNEYDPLPIENYISKGWIADIGKLIEKDEELSQVEFLQNVFDAYSVDGTLYYVVPEFELNTMAAKKALVGDRTGWGMEDMQQILAGMGENAKAFGDVTRDSFMYMVMQYCGNQFVDVKTGKCSFNTEDFISMMEYAKTLPEEIVYDDDYWMNYDWSQEMAQYREDRTLMMQLSIYSMQEVVTTMNGYFGEPIEFVGFPTKDGSGAYVQGSTTYALSARSANQEGAWQFVRYYLTEEYQKEEVNYLPVSKTAFMEKAKTAMERPYWENEDGTKEYYDYSIYLNGEDIILDPLTQEQLNQVTDYIQTISNRYYYNDDIMNIVNEEIGAFYAGQKSAQDVADVIQRRAQIYVDENN